MHSTRYRIVPRDPHAHLFEIHCTVCGPAPGGQRFRLPAWIPGSYWIREFARQFIEVRAEAGGAALPIGSAAAQRLREAWLHLA